MAATTCCEAERQSIILFASRAVYCLVETRWEDQKKEQKGRRPYRRPGYRGVPASSSLYIGFSGCCDRRMPKRFLIVTRCLENLSSGENRAERRPDRSDLDLR